MRNDFEQLLDATMAHVEALKRKGATFLPVAAKTLEDLTRRLPAATPQRVSDAPPPAAAATVQKPGITHAPAVASRKITEAAQPAPIPDMAQKAFAGSVMLSPDVASAPLERSAKEAAMEELRARAIACRMCGHLVVARKNVVFGVGDIHSPLMFVGEAPGADEDVQGEPFVGRAGQLLTRIIQTMGFSREQVYIANILKCRPDTPGQAAGNRKPTAEEMKTCLPYLLAQIDIVRPRVIVALGATAVEGLMGRMPGISRLRGQWLTFREIPLMPTYHPAYLLRNQSLKTKREVWEDMLKVLERLERPISEKQRNYFLTN